MDEKPRTFWQRRINPRPLTREWWQAGLIGTIVFGALLGGVVALFYFFPGIVGPQP
jgi:hypothetical protein